MNPLAAAGALCCSLCLSAQTLPFVGCTTYGQSEKYPPPAKPKRVVELPPHAAQKLAYYESAIGPGVLAPRDWSCECLWGSSGTLFRITPQPIARTKLEIGGAGIVVVDSDGATSGRYEIAEVIARIFPEHWAWARRTLDGVDDAGNVRYGPIPNGSPHLQKHPNCGISHRTKFRGPWHSRRTKTKRRPDRRRGDSPRRPARSIAPSRRPTPARHAESNA